VASDIESIPTAVNFGTNTVSTDEPGEPPSADVAAFGEAIAGTESESQVSPEDLKKSFSDWLFTQIRESAKETEKRVKEDLDKQKQEIESEGS
jgi:hypothetical protein